MSQNSKKNSQIDLRDSQFGGGLVDAETVHAQQIGGNVNNFAPKPEQNLAEAAREIQQLLQQLEESNPTATEVEKQAFVTAALPPTKRERLASAVKAGGKAAIEEVLDNPYLNTAMAIIEGWRNPD